VQGHEKSSTTLRLDLAAISAPNTWQNIQRREPLPETAPRRDIPVLSQGSITVIQPVPLFKGLQGVNYQYFVGEGNILFYSTSCIETKSKVQNPIFRFFFF